MIIYMYVDHEACKPEKCLYGECDGNRCVCLDGYFGTRCQFG